jgi:hypothetical protein
LLNVETTHAKGRFDDTGQFSRFRPAVSVPMPPKFTTKSVPQLLHDDEDLLAVADLDIADRLAVLVKRIEFGEELLDAVLIPRVLASFANLLLGMRNRAFE